MWWPSSILVPLILCFLAGLLLGLAIWGWQRRKAQSEYERRRLEAEAESDRLRLRVSSLKASDERAKSLEGELVGIRARAARVPKLEGELAKIKGRADIVPGLQHQVVELRDRAAQVEPLEAKMRAMRFDLDESRGQAVKFEVELMAARSDTEHLADQFADDLAAKAGRIAELEAEVEELRRRQRPPEPEGGGEAAEEWADAGSWQSGRTTVGTPGAAHVDDLKVINGIGPVLEKTLNELGIQTWEQLAAFTRADIDKVDDELAFPGRIDRDQWVAQAKDLIKQFPRSASYDRPSQTSYLPAI